MMNLETSTQAILTIVVPVRNEELNIIPFLNEIKMSLCVAHSILIVYDSDTDNTLSKLEFIQKNFSNVRFVKNKYQPGFINAIRTGIQSTKTEFLVPMMADLSDDPASIAVLLEKMDQGYDLAIGSRYCKGGSKIGGPRFKAFLSKLAGKSLHFLTGIPTHDITSAYVIHRTANVQKIEIESNGGFEVAMELIVKSHLMGLKIAEVPTTNRDRAAGVSKFRFFAWIKKYLHWYLFAIFKSLRFNL